MGPTAAPSLFDDMPEPQGPEPTPAPPASDPALTPQAAAPRPEPAPEPVRPPAPAEPSAPPVPGGYSASSIEVLEGLEPVRKRPGMYIGGTDERALHHLFAEVLDNAMDEAVAGHAKIIEVHLDAEGALTVVDNGIGIGVEAASQRAGLGISSMRGRVEVLGGRLTVRKLKVGTSVSATVPLRARQPESSAA